ncbi:hypothetical protein [Azospirillum sp. TSO35-2]|uniref:hypothetical protein n=1 Tax=Azospirillum sp. TSO35-2 TaxID=716796 RepID=UPI000D60F84A|nr:hypothetical protein [Azospirillum sp. TSO35-2]PWC31382.1 hypothetical protein TSO352_31955 [Azospirillum sp. TSO35-2]
MNPLDHESAVFAAKFAVARFVFGVILFAIVAVLANVNTDAILAADETRAAVAFEMVKTIPVTVADASH